MITGKDIYNNIPNIISTGRLVMAFFLPAIFAFSNPVVTLLYCTVGILSDLVDGYLAKNVMKHPTKYGKVMDPLADKTFNIVALFHMGMLINPLLFSLLVPEVIIAGVTTTHAIHNIKEENKKIAAEKNKVKKNKEKTNFWAKVHDLIYSFGDNLYTFFDAVDKLEVSRFGRVKAGVMFLAVFSTLLTPALAGAFYSSIFLTGLTFAMEWPVFTKYFVELRKSFGDVTKIEQTGLNWCDALDRWVIRTTEKVKSVFRSKKNDKIADDQALVEQFNTVEDIEEDIVEIPSANKEIDDNSLSAKTDDFNNECTRNPNNHIIYYLYERNNIASRRHGVIRRRNGIARTYKR